MAKVFVLIRVACRTVPPREYILFFARFVKIFVRISSIFARITLFFVRLSFQEHIPLAPQGKKVTINEFSMKNSPLYPINNTNNPQHNP
jgi:hypothetical protein